jgi:hypothetical protein
LAITIQGVDHVISMSRTAKAERLLLGQAGRVRGYASGGTDDEDDNEA